MKSIASVCLHVALARLSQEAALQGSGRGSSALIALAPGYITCTRYCRFCLPGSFAACGCPTKTISPKPYGDNERQSCFKEQTRACSTPFSVIIDVADQLICLPTLQVFGDAPIRATKRYNLPRDAGTREMSSSLTTAWTPRPACCCGASDMTSASVPGTADRDITRSDEVQEEESKLFC